MIHGRLWHWHCPQSGSMWATHLCLCSSMSGAVSLQMPVSASWDLLHCRFGSFLLHFLTSVTFQHQVVEFIACARFPKYFICIIEKRNQLLMWEMQDVVTKRDCLLTWGHKCQGFWLPWALLAVNTMFGHPFLVDLLGIVVGHFYYFLTVLHPQATGHSYLKTPRWVYPLTVVRQVKILCLLLFFDYPLCGCLQSFFAVDVCKTEIFSFLLCRSEYAELFLGFLPSGHKLVKHVREMDVGVECALPVWGLVLVAVAVSFSLTDSISDISWLPDGLGLKRPQLKQLCLLVLGLLFLVGVTDSINRTHW